MFRKKLEMPDLCRAVIELSDRYKSDVVLIEDKGSGTGLLQSLRAKHFYKGTPYLPKGDKVVRFANITPMIESGLVFLPDQAPWRDDYLHELCGFPATRNDDQIDSTSQALQWIRDQGTFDGLLEYYRLLNEESRAAVEDRTVHLRAPHGISHAGLRDGWSVPVGPDGCVWVTPCDAGPLRRAGYVEMRS